MSPTNLPPHGEAHASAPWLDNWSYKLLSVLIALGLWFLVRDERVVERFRVPLEVVAPKGLVLVDEPPAAINVHIEGTRIELDDLRRDDPLEIRVKLDAHGPGKVEFNIAQDQLPLPNKHLEIMSMSPSRGSVYLEQVVQRTLPVRPSLVGQPAEGFELAGVQVVPKQVAIAGAKSHVYSRDAVFTQPIDVTGWDTSHTEPVPLAVSGSRFWMVHDSPVVVTVEIRPTPPQAPSGTEGQGAEMHAADPDPKAGTP